MTIHLKFVTLHTFKNSLNCIFSAIFVGRWRWYFLQKSLTYLKTSKAKTITKFFFSVHNWMALSGILEMYFYAPPLFEFCVLIWLCCDCRQPASTCALEHMHVCSVRFCFDIPTVSVGPAWRNPSMTLTEPVDIVKSKLKTHLSRLSIDSRCAQHCQSAISFAFSVLLHYISGRMVTLIQNNKIK